MGGARHLWAEHLVCLIVVGLVVLACVTVVIVQFSWMRQREREYRDDLYHRDQTLVQVLRERWEDDYYRLHGILQQHVELAQKFGSHAANYTTVLRMLTRAFHNLERRLKKGESS